MVEGGNKNSIPNTIPSQFTDTEESMFGDTTEKFWREAMGVCDEVERQNFATNAATSPMQITQTIQRNPCQTKQTKQTKIHL